MIPSSILMPPIVSSSSEVSTLFSWDQSLLGQILYIIRACKSCRFFFYCLQLYCLFAWSGETELVLIHHFNCNIILLMGCQWKYTYEFYNNCDIFHCILSWNTLKSFASYTSLLRLKFLKFWYLKLKCVIIINGKK